MKTFVSFLIPLVLAVFIFLGLVFFFNQKMGKGALQVTSVPQSAVYLNGKLQGTTPLCKCEAKDLLAEGEYTLKLIPKTGDFQPFEDKIAINRETLSVLDRTFGQGGESEGSIITLSQIPDKKESQILVLSFPDKARISLDNNQVGSSPILLKKVTESDHQLQIGKDGYKEKLLKISTVPGYKLTSLVFLGVSPQTISSPSSSVRPSPQAVPSIQKILILNTPTGFLRVREEASLGSLQIGQVIPGDTFELMEEKNGWFKINLGPPAGEGKLGWVNGDYAKKQ